MQRGRVSRREMTLKNFEAELLHKLTDGRSRGVGEPGGERVLLLERICRNEGDCMSTSIVEDAQVAHKRNFFGKDSGRLTI